MDRPLWAPTDVDITRPSVARVYDYYLGGSHNFESDRAFGQPGRRRLPRAAHRAAREPRPSCGAWCATWSARGRRPVPRPRLGHPDGGQRARGRPGGQPGGAGRVRRPRPRRRHPRPRAAGRRPPRTAVVAADLLDPEHVLAQAVAVGGAGPAPARRRARPRGAALRSGRASGRPRSWRTTCARVAPGSHLVDQPQPLGTACRRPWPGSGSTPANGPWNRCTRARAAEVDGAVRRPDTGRARRGRRTGVAAGPGDEALDVPRRLPGARRPVARRD